MQKTSKYHVAILGGGLAGLSSAEDLLRREGDQVTVTVIDAGKQPGGVIRTEYHDGWVTEGSADSFLAVRPEGIELVKRLGLEDDIISVADPVRRALILHKGQLIPIPAGFRLLAPGQIRSILRTPALSLPGKLRVLCEPLISKSNGDDESLEHFATRRLGREAFEQLVQPLVAGIWTADPMRLSMAAACPDFLAMEQEHGSLFMGERARLKQSPRGQAASGARYGQFVSLSKGMETLPLRLTEYVQASGADFIQEQITNLQYSRGRWQVVLDRHSPLEADAVIVALPAPKAAQILRSACPAVASDLDEIEYAGSAVVSLGYEKTCIAHPLNAAGLVIPRSEGRSILAISFLSSKFPGRAPDGHALIRVFVGGALDPEASTLDDSVLLERVQREAADILGIQGVPKLSQINRWHTSMPQYHVGHVERVRSLFSRVSAISHFALAGAAYSGVGIPQVIASGQQAARDVLESKNKES